MLEFRDSMGTDPLHVGRRKFIAPAARFPAFLALFLGLASLAAAADGVRFERVAVSEADFSRPHDLVLSPNSRFLYVADVGNDSVRVLDPESLKTLGRIGEGRLSAPHDVSFDSGGRLWVADTGNDRTAVYEISGPEGREIDAFGAEQGSPEGVAVAGDGRVYVTNASRDTVLVLKDGAILKRLGRGGNVLDQFSRPHDIHIARDNRVFIVDPGNNRIQVRDLELKLLITLKGAGFNFREPKYVATDARGWLYVADEYNNQIKVFDTAYRLQGRIGDGRAGRGEGRLKQPEGVEVRGDELWISDTYNDRILRYRIHR